MNMKINANPVAAAILMASSVNAWALEPVGIKLEDGHIITPTLQVSERYDDNFRAVEVGEEDTWITSITPTITLAGEGSKSSHSLSYTAVIDTFHSSRKDNNTDHHATADLGFEFDARNKLKFDAAYDYVEETASKDQSVENDKYDTYKVGGVYSYGVESALAQIDLGAKVYRLQYHNSGTLNAGKEYDSAAFNAIGYYRVGSKTRVLLEARHTGYDYITNTGLNSNNIALLGGAVWDATAKTTGSVKLGAEEKRYDTVALEDNVGSMWEVAVTWSPLSYSTFELNSRRGFNEGSSGASVISSQSSSLDWKHEWLDRLTSDATYTHSTEDYEGNVNQRVDVIDSLALGLTYGMRRWLDVGIGYKYAETDSNVAGESDKRNIFLVSLTGSL